jgi:hypothetical protein
MAAPGIELLIAHVRKVEARQAARGEATLDRDEARR